MDQETETKARQLAEKLKPGIEIEKVYQVPFAVNNYLLNGKKGPRIVPIGTVNEPEYFEHTIKMGYSPMYKTLVIALHEVRQTKTTQQRNRHKSKKEQACQPQASTTQS